jgi:hypothetical protein
MVHGWSTPRRT